MTSRRLETPFLSATTSRAASVKDVPLLQERNTESIPVRVDTIDDLEEGWVQPEAPEGYGEPEYNY